MDRVYRGYRILTEEQRQEYLKKYLASCKEALENDEDLLAQYLKELPILKCTIAKHASAARRPNPYNIITSAVMDISRHRAGERKPWEWSCGTQTSSNRDFVNRWLHYLFSDDDLMEVITTCADNDIPDEDHKETLLLLLHNTPRTVVFIDRGLRRFYEET